MRLPWTKRREPQQQVSLVGYWTCLDELSPDELEEDWRILEGRFPSPYADNVVLPSGRSWRFVRP